MSRMFEGMISAMIFIILMANSPRADGGRNQALSFVHQCKPEVSKVITIGPDTR